jgi:hypothetical protein
MHRREWAFKASLTWYFPPVSGIMYPMKTLRIFPIIVALGFLLIAGFYLDSVEATDTSPTATATTDSLPSSERTLQPIAPSAIPTPDGTEGCQSDLHRAQHMVVADINYEAHTVTVQQRITIANQTDSEWEQVVLNVEANLLRGAFILGRIDTGQENFTYALNQQHLEVTLEDPLQPGCEMVITLDYRLNVPAVGEMALSAKGFFAYTERQLNLGHWLATVAIRQDDGWVMRQATSIGEQGVLEKADWEVVVNLVNPPENLTIAAPGTISPINSTSWRYVHHNSREFSISLSDQFFVISEVISTGVMVEVYTLNNAKKNNAADHALDMATRSMTMFSDLFGNTPYPRMVIVQGDFPDGMEFSGLVFVGNRWFRQYADNPACYLTLITVHEVSHQWWYAMVGNDSALSPWLDEALATYSEYVFLEEYYPGLKDWWWQFRVEQYSPGGYVDSTVYDFENSRDYINAVYLRGAQMMQALREDLGTEAFFQFLADYANAGNGEINTPELFWSLMSPEQIEQTQITRNLFLQRPYVESRDE